MQDVLKHALAGVALAAGRLTVVIPETGEIHWRSVGLEAAQAFLLGAGAWQGVKTVRSRKRS